MSSSSESTNSNDRRIREITHQIQYLTNELNLRLTIRENRDISRASRSSSSHRGRSIGIPIATAVAVNPGTPDRRFTTPDRRIADQTVVRGRDRLERGDRVRITNNYQGLQGTIGVVSRTQQDWVFIRIPGRDRSVRRARHNVEHYPPRR